MYYCEERVPLDRSHLAISRQRYFKNSRADLNEPQKSKARKPRATFAQRPRMPAMMNPYPHGQLPEDPGHGVMAPMPHPDPNAGWQCVQPASLVYGTVPGGPPPPMYAAPPGHYIAPAPQPYGHPPPPGMYAQPMYAAAPGQVVYAPPPQPMAMSPPDARGGRRGKKARASHEPQMVVDPYYGHSYDPYAQPPPPPMEPMGHMAPVGDEEDPSNSWIQEPGSGDAGDYGRAAKRSKHGGPSEPPAPPPPSAPAPEGGAPEGDDAGGMSNKTLDIMLGRLQGQLPPATYEKVITLVRDVQCRRMSLSRSEFLQHFQAICAGNPKPTK